MTNAWLSGFSAILAGMRPWNRELGTRQARIAAFSKQALGSIQVVPASNLTDGDAFTLADGVSGHSPITFEYDFDGMVGLGHVPIHIFHADSLADVAGETIAAINGVGDALRVSAFQEIIVPGLVGLANDLVGIAGNIPVISSVADLGFVVTGMDGGTDADDATGGIESALEGDYVFTLGYKIPDLRHLFLVGDFAQVSQTADFGSAKIARIRAIIRAPQDPMPAGTAWRVSLSIDGIEMVGRNLETKRNRRFVDLAANVSGLASGNHALAIRVELVSV